MLCSSLWMLSWLMRIWKRCFFWSEMTMYSGIWNMNWVWLLLCTPRDRIQFRFFNSLYSKSPTNRLKYRMNSTSLFRNTNDRYMYTWIWKP